MYGTISQEMEVNVPASQAWEVYGTLLLSQVARKVFMGKCLKAGFEKAEVIEGDGGVGTILHYFFVPGNASWLPSFKEKFVTIDNEKRVKEKEMIEGGYLDLGFSLYRIRFEVREKSEDWCITRYTVEYEIKEAVDDDQVATMMTGSTKVLFTVLEAANNYLIDNKN